MVFVILVIIFISGMIVIAHERYWGIFLMLSAFISLTGYTYTREQVIKEYLNGEVVVDTLSMSAEGKVLDLELKWETKE